MERADSSGWHISVQNELHRLSSRVVEKSRSGVKLSRFKHIQTKITSGKPYDYIPTSITYPSWGGGTKS